MQRPRRRIAFFGGSFDPVHLGHLAMARAAVEELGLHRLCFVPAARNPHKKDGPVASGAHRLEMLRLAIGREPRFGIWDAELEREGPSYTLHSVEHIERVYPNSHAFWIIGTDQLEGLPRWYGVQKLVTKVGFILVTRPGYQLHWPCIPGLYLYPVENPLLPISSTEVRGRLMEGAEADDLLAPEVLAYIRRHRLYSTKATETIA